MYSEELLNYVFAKLNEAPKIAQDNIKREDTPFKNREIYFKVKKHIDDFLKGDIHNRFVVMPGLRGVGKTTVLFQLYEYLRKEKDIEVDRILYISADELNSLLGAKLREVIDVFIGEVHETSPVFLDKDLFILVDEAHYDEEWSMTGKIIYDQSRKIFMIFTGSSALDLEINVDAARRIKKEPVFPMNFREYNLLENEISIPAGISDSLRDLIFKGEQSVNQGLKDELEMKKSLLKLNKPADKEWEDFLYCREFPFGLQMERMEIYQRIYGMVSRVIEKDVTSLQSFNTETLSTISRITTFLALQTPGGTSDVKLAGRLGKSPRSIRMILDVLEKTHLIFSVKPYGSAGKIVRKPWKYYFLSPSINAAIRFKLGRYQPKSRELLGVLAENLVGSYFFRLKETLDIPLGIFYDPDDMGVDFLLQDVEGNIIPVEVGVGRKDKSQVKKAVRKYSSDHGILISNATDKITREGKVISIPLLTFSFM